MHHNGPAVGLLALCGVLATAIAVPLSQPRARLDVPTQTRTDDYLALPGPGTSLLERRNIDVLAIHTRSARELDELFQTLGFQWPHDASREVPAVEVAALPIDLDRLEVQKKKSLFFRTLLPLIALENRLIREQRALLSRAFLRGWIEPDSEIAATLRSIAEHYRVRGDVNSRQFRETLLRRVDVVPAGLVLAQAASESGWGTSRFARSANNLFGVWTYKRRFGVEPSEREEGTRHAVRAYPSLRRAVRSYLFNLNVGHAYRDLRELRATMRREGRALNPHELAGGLIRYSSRGEAYVEEIRRLIRINKLNDLVSLRLASAAR